MPDTGAFHYRAFLSYSRHDTAWARWLHSALENYHIDKDLVGRETPLGPVPGTLRPIFLDRMDFAAGHSLAEHTIAALKASHSLVVVCSPAAARSTYVNQEIRQFKSLGRPDRIIPIIVDGEPGGGENECFPSALRERGGGDGAPDDESEQPIAADARAHGDGKDIVKQKVAAGLLGIGLDEVVQRAEKARRKRLRVAIGLVAAVALAMAGLAGWAEVNRREAVIQRVFADGRQKEAERNFAIATQAAENLVFDIAQGLRDVQGMPSKTVNKILDRAEEVITRLAEESGNDLRLLANRVAMLSEFSSVYGVRGDVGRQLSSAQSAVAITEQVSAAHPHDTGWLRYLGKAYVTLGDAWKARGDLINALGAYRKALEIRQKLVELEPRNIFWRRELSIPHERVGIIFKVQGNLPEAEKSHRAALEIIEELAKAYPEKPEWQRDLSLSYRQTADVVERNGNPAEAINLRRKSLELAKQLVALQPDNTFLKNILAQAANDLGVALASEGDQEEAMLHLRGALAVQVELTRADPENKSWQKQVYFSYMNIGDALRKQGKLSESLLMYRDALDLLERIANPDDALDQQALTVSYTRLGDLLSAMGNSAEALGYFKSELAVRKRLADADPSNTRLQRELSYADSAVAMTLMKRGSLKEALPRLRELLDLREQVVAADPNSSQRKRELQNGIGLVNELAGKLILAGDFATALEASDSGIAVDSTLTWLHSNRAHALMLIGRLDEARAVYLRHRGEHADAIDTRVWESIILDDFAALRRAGMSHPLMDEIEKQFGS